MSTTFLMRNKRAMCALPAGIDPRCGQPVQRFHAYMQDTTEQKARAAEQHLDTTIAVIRALEPTSPQVAAVLVELQASDPSLADITTAWLKAAGQ